MPRPPRLQSLLGLRALEPRRPALFPTASSRLQSSPQPARRRQMHNSAVKPASVIGTIGAGPPPDAPRGAETEAEAVETDAYARAARIRKRAELLQRAKELRAMAEAEGGVFGGSSAGRAARMRKRKRFWEEVHVREVDGALQIHLDTRPLRRPESNIPVSLPATKPVLANALALEWELIETAAQATRQHLIPLTSLVCRALDIRDDDSSSNPTIRPGLASSLLRYLDTDTLLCWAPSAEGGGGGGVVVADNDESLRSAQQRAAAECIAYLTRHAWPGVAIGPVLDGDSIMPRRHPDATREAVGAWIKGLDCWELAAFERAVLAGKSLLNAARLVVEWSEGAAGRNNNKASSATQPSSDGHGGPFGLEEAARAASIEVDWQTGVWGEVEDTHDVEKEDVRRQYGSAVLLVSGNRRS